jgi:hypothetical protein
MVAMYWHSSKHLEELLRKTGDKIPKTLFKNPDNPLHARLKIGSSYFPSSYLSRDIRKRLGGRVFSTYVWQLSFL